MQVDLQRRRRSRTHASKTTGVIVRSLHDARGIAEPLERYGELLACQIVSLYNALHGLPPTSRHTLARLKQLFHESEGLTPNGRLLLRPEYQWRYGRNHQTIYRRAPGTGRYLVNQGLYDLDAARWACASRVVRISNDSRQTPSDHDIALSFIMSSLEIAVRRQPELRFISHIDIITNASPEARQATFPLAIPLPAMDHTPGASCRAELAGTRLKPDALFGVQYPPLNDPDYRFFALEYDRGTEDVEPRSNLRKSSWLRKILSYDAISVGPHPLHETYLRIPNLLVLCLFCDTERLTNAMRVAASYASFPQQFLFKAIPPVDPLLTATSMPQLLHEPWQRLGGTFNIATLEGR